MYVYLQVQCTSVEWNRARLLLRILELVRHYSTSMLIYLYVRYSYPSIAAQMPKANLSIFWNSWTISKYWFLCLFSCISHFLSGTFYWSQCSFRICLKTALIRRMKQANAPIRNSNHHKIMSFVYYKYDCKYSFEPRNRVLEGHKQLIRNK